MFISNRYNLDLTGKYFDEKYVPASATDLVITKSVLIEKINANSPIGDLFALLPPSDADLSKYSRIDLANAMLNIPDAVDDPVPDPTPDPSSAPTPEPTV